MKKFRGFRLGKKLSFFWNSCNRYHRLNPDRRPPTLGQKIINWLCRRSNVASAPPKGHLAVYVGREGVDPLLYRVVLPIIFFNHPLFGELLKRAQEEFGYGRSGGIVIPCTISDFEVVRRRVAAAAGVRCRHCGKAEPWILS